MFDFLLVSNIFFEVWGYQVSFLEFFGTLTYFASVLLIARKNMLNWPVGIVSVVLYMLLFYQFQLYSDALEQVYYLGASVVGWVLWSRSRSNEQVPSGFSSQSAVLITAASTLVAGLALGFFMVNVHEVFPALFPLPADYPMLDAMTTVISLVAMWLLALRRTESWVYWIIVDIAGIYLYFSKGLAFLGVQYVVLLVIALYGFWSWFRSSRTNQTFPAQ